MNYTVKRDVKKISNIIGEKIGNINLLYNQLKNDYPQLSFILIGGDEGQETIHFNDPNSGKYGVIYYDQNNRHSWNDFGFKVSKDNPFYREGEKLDVPISYYEGVFEKFTEDYPDTEQLAGDAIESSAIWPSFYLSVICGIDIDHLDLVVSY